MEACRKCLYERAYKDKPCQVCGGEEFIDIPPMTAEEQMQKMERFHPKAMKLLRKEKPFIVVASDEPYYARVYGMIREQEIKQGTWTAGDEEWYQQEIEAREGVE